MNPDGQCPPFGWRGIRSRQPQMGIDRLSDTVCMMLMSIQFRAPSGKWHGSTSSFLAPKSLVQAN